MNTPNVHAGRLERRVRPVGKETMPGIHGFCSFYPFGAIRGVPLLRLTALPEASLVLSEGVLVHAAVHGSVIALVFPSFRVVFAHNLPALG